MRIAVDAMGGDHAPARPVDGALAAARPLGLEVDLVGSTHLIRAEPSWNAVLTPPLWTCGWSTRPTSSTWPNHRRGRCAGLCIVGHGRSSVKAVRNALPSRMAEKHMVERLRIEMAAFAVTL